MRRLHLRAAQMALELAPPTSSAMESLRAAFSTLDIARRLTFEQAMANRAYSICIRNLAEAFARRRRRHTAVCL